MLLLVRSDGLTLPQLINNAVLSYRSRSRARLLSGGFDGVYTYFASEGFSFGSRTVEWRHLQNQMEAAGKLFIPSVGPGYIDTRVRPWNAQNSKGRGHHGSYYKRMIRSALALKPRIISITSWNEWHEGTQIEPAKPFTSSVVSPGRTTPYTYMDYEADGGPNAYLDITRIMAGELELSTRNAGVLASRRH